MNEINWYPAPGEKESYTPVSDLKELDTQSLVGELSQNSKDARINDTDKSIVKIAVDRIKNEDDIIFQATMKNLDADMITNSTDLAEIHDTLSTYLQIDPNSDIANFDATDPEFPRTKALIKMARTHIKDNGLVTLLFSDNGFGIIGESITKTEQYKNLRVYEKSNNLESYANTKGVSAKEVGTDINEGSRGLGAQVPVFISAINTAFFYSIRINKSELLSRTNNNDKKNKYKNLPETFFAESNEKVFWGIRQLGSWMDENNTTMSGRNKFGIKQDGHVIPAIESKQIDDLLTHSPVLKSMDTTGLSILMPLPFVKRGENPLTELGPDFEKDIIKKNAWIILNEKQVFKLYKDFKTLSDPDGAPYKTIDFEYVVDKFGTDEFNPDIHYQDPKLYEQINMMMDFVIPGQNQIKHEVCIELGKNNTKPSSRGPQWAKIENKLNDEIEQIKKEVFEDNSINLKNKFLLEISIANHVKECACNDDITFKQCSDFGKIFIFFNDKKYKNKNRIFLRESQVLEKEPLSQKSPYSFIVKLGYEDDHTSLKLSRIVRALEDTNHNRVTDKQIEDSVVKNEFKQYVETDPKVYWAIARRIPAIVIDKLFSKESITEPFSYTDDILTAKNIKDGGINPDIEVVTGVGLSFSKNNDFLIIHRKSGKRPIPLQSLYIAIGLANESKLTSVTNSVLNMNHVLRGYDGDTLIDGMYPEIDENFHDIFTDRIETKLIKSDGTDNISDLLIKNAFIHSEEIINDPEQPVKALCVRLNFNTRNYSSDFSGIKITLPPLIQSFRNDGNYVSRITTWDILNEVNV